MKNLIETLSIDLKTWATQTLPIAKNSLVPIARLDQSCSQINMETLFFGAGEPEDFSCSGKVDLKMLRQEVVSTGHLRNSFYPEVFSKHSKIENVHLVFNLSGAFAYSVSQARLHHPPESLAENVIDAAMSEDGQTVVPTETKLSFSLDTDIGKNARLFWTLRALSDDATIHDAVWMGTAPQETQGRMVVVLRTFGRTTDIKNLLAAFEEQSRYSPHYARILKNIFFYVLDTSNNVSAEDYAEIGALEHITAHVVSGANLGGGGNMSQALLYLDKAIDAAQITVDEVLLLDDDLRLSLESLCRHWGSTLARSDDTVFTLPVFMKSEPRRMWEDGGFWGRFLDNDMTSDRASIAPRLLRHGRQFGRYDFLDEIAPAHYPEYCTFIFFSLPYKRFKTLGYPAAFFLRGDDIEYSLRHRKAGGKTFSNPNLCAWHEPAHSYGQEYMSIAHGIIINMRYGNEKADAFAKFFYRRLMSHASIGDAIGLQVYTEVLRDLNSKTVFLQNNFAKHYVAKLGVFKTFDKQFEYLSAELRDDLRANSAQRNTFIGEYSFLYPPVEGNPKLSRVILENPHTGLFRLYNPLDTETIEACAQVAADFTSELAAFLNNYDALRNHYLAQFDAVEDEAFWEDEMALHSAPKVLFTNNK